MAGGRAAASGEAPATSDRDEILDLLASYGALLDRERFDEWLDLFVPDGEYLVFGRTFVGHDGLRKINEHAPGGLHLGAFPQITVDGDEATAAQSFLFIDQKTHEQRIGWYDDDLVRVDDRWRFARRRCTFLTADGPADRP